MKRKTFLSLLVIGMAASPLCMAQADVGAFPSRPIQIVVGFPPGGATDLAARVVGAQLSKSLGQPVVIENRAGAGSILGATHVAKAAPDGYTLLIGSSSSLAINQSLHEKLPYDPATDFVAIGTVGQTPGILAVHPDVPAKNVAELVHYMKGRSGELSYASAGNGTFQHLLAELFMEQTGTKALHIPYKGSTPALSDVAGGHVGIVFDVVPSAAPLVKVGKLRAIAVSSKQRSELLPDVPTMTESGLTGLEAGSWWGIVAPAGTPEAIVARLSDELVRIAGSPETRESLLKIGASPLAMPAPEFSTFLERESARWAGIIKSRGIKAD